jgi:hypothetical protein
VAVVAALASCTSQPEPTDVVRDSQTAISVAKAACLRGAPDEGRWNAVFKNNLWEVTQVFEHSRMGCNYGLHVIVWPDNGKTKQCEECAVDWDALRTK